MDEEEREAEKIMEDDEDCSTEAKTELDNGWSAQKIDTPWTRGGQWRIMTRQQQLGSSLLLEERVQGTIPYHQHDPTVIILIWLQMDEGHLFFLHLGVCYTFDSILPDSHNAISY
eukprot:scaffold124060_cov39-Attheya_sp.AAC.3